MTFVRRSVLKHPDITQATKLLKDGKNDAAVELLSFQLRKCLAWNSDLLSSPLPGVRPNATFRELVACFYYLRAMARLDTGWKLGGTAELYKSAIDDFRESFALDWKPLAEHGNIFPEHDWAFPAYVDLLKDCLSQVRQPGFFSAKLKSERLASRIARAIATIGGTNDALVDVLMEFAQIEPSVELCEFRRALAALGWKPSLHGFAQVTNNDIQNPDRRRDSQREHEAWLRWCDFGEGTSLSEEENEEIFRQHSALAKHSIPDLRVELTSNDNFRRAAARLLLMIAEATPAIDECASDLRDSHRFVRLSAIHCVVERLAASEAAIGEVEFMKSLDLLFRAISEDRAGICRRAGLIGLAKIARRVHEPHNVELASRCRSLVDAALSDNQREAVHGAIIAARHFGPFSQERLQFITQVPVEHKERYGKPVFDWLTVCDKAETIFALTPPHDPLRVIVWNEFRPLLGNSFQPTRLAAIRTIQRLRLVDRDFIEELRPLLVRRACIDDSCEVRKLAKATLEQLP